jgi:hypothetical protein
MLSREKRKRYRRQAEEAALRGDRTKPSAGGWGGFCGDWETASRGELRLLRRAIREDWPIPGCRRGPIIEEVSQILDSGDTRRALAAISVLAEADLYNLKLEGLIPPDYRFPSTP